MIRGRGGVVEQSKSYSSCFRKEKKSVSWPSSNDNIRKQKLSDHARPGMLGNGLVCYSCNVKATTKKKAAEELLLSSDVSSSSQEGAGPYDHID